MKKFKKIIRLLCLILMILLASIGVGLAGGMPIPINARREDMTTEVKIEQVDKKEDESDSDNEQSMF
ncbi:hypothetical protein SAMN03097699_0642 [Flavobacteriaceae bacterium MAR_2010_188]|nr:hypothetical protein SAMN03097699_0642 [Flavobacteriaceae bacterium MAR_2010_188]